MMSVAQKGSRYLTIGVMFVITIMCQALSDQPKFAEPIPNITVALGRDVSLPCVVENLGTYKVAWLHVNRHLLVTMHKRVVGKLPRFRITNENEKRWILNIEKIEQQDRGFYMCQVNTDPMISQVGYVEVVVPPNILDAHSTESTIAVREYDNITLTCKADGYPQPKLSWKRENNEDINIDRRKKVKNYEGEQLNIMKISRQEMGAYLCIAKNGVPPTVSKRITVDVEFSPMIWVKNQLVGAPAGTNATIDCVIEAFPRAINYWILNNTMVPFNDKYVVTDTAESRYKTKMQLTIRNLMKSDFGNYKCISKNSLGETEGSIRLYEIPRPSVIPKATEIKSVVHKNSMKSTPTPLKRLTTSWPVPYTPYYPKWTEKPSYIEDINDNTNGKRNTYSAGSSQNVRWTAPQLVVVAVQYILTGPHIPPNVPQAVN